MGDIENTYKMLFRTHEGKRPRCKWGHDVTMFLQKQNVCGLSINIAEGSYEHGNGPPDCIKVTHIGLANSPSSIAQQRLVGQGLLFTITLRHTTLGRTPLDR
jgi:hypothetical protein